MSNKNKICDLCKKNVEKLFLGSFHEEKICSQCLENNRYIENENDCQT